MATSSHSSPKHRSDAAPGGDRDILVCETCPGRSVFVEAGNRDAWISTDLTVDLGR